MVPITFHAKKLAIRNWERIQRGNGNILLLASHKYAVQNNFPWSSAIRDTFASNGLQDIYLSFTDNTFDGRSPATTLIKRLIDQFHQTSMESINNSHKMKVLSLLKQTPGTEVYLHEIKNPKHRQAMSKLRLSSHKLEIERGRYDGTASNERFCSYCQKSGHNIVEDEMHFLLHCPMFKELREKLLPLATLNDHSQSDSEKFVNIMTFDPQVTAKYIHRAFEIRDLCLDVMNTLKDITDYVEDICIKTQHEVDVIMPYRVRKVSKTGLNLVFSRIDLTT